MKNILNILLTVLFFYSLSNAEVIKKSYFFSDFKIVDVGEYQTINFENTVLTGKIGEPILPYHAVALLLPPAQVIESIEIIVEDETEIEGQYQLYPVQPARKYSAAKSAEFIKNIEIYNSDAEYPVSKMGKVSTEFLNGYTFGISTFTPLKYNPATGKVSFFKKVIIKIDTKSGSNAVLKNLSSSFEVLKRVANFAQNPEMISCYAQRPGSPDDYQILIITPSEFEHEYNELIALHLKRGLKTEIVTIEVINSSITGKDLQEKIRNYIITEYQAHSVEYVLLGGDAELVPYRGFYCTVETGGYFETDYGIPSDLYYSAIDGSWNDDGDELWGEIGENDLLPDISIARFTISNSTDLNNMLHKTISYMDTPVLNELRKPLLLAEKLWDAPLTWGGDLMDLIIGHKDDNGYTTDGIPEDHDIKKLYDRTSRGWDYKTLLPIINEGHSFIHHDGHSNYTYTMRLYYSHIIDGNFSLVNGIDHNYTPIYAKGCNCGGFDRDDCIGERMVNIKNLAVAFIGNSRYGWFNEGTTEGPATHLHREFVDALYGNNSGRIGDAHLESKINSAPWVNAPDQHEEGAMRWNFYASNVLGDPAMTIWTDEPISIHANFQNPIPTNLTSLYVNVTKNELPVQDLNCVLMKDSTMYGVGITNSIGFAEIKIDHPITEVGAAEIIISGYNCLPTYFPLNITTNVDVVDNLQPSNAKLLGNYPNPFNSQTIIRFDIFYASEVFIKIYNIQGKLIRTLINGQTCEMGTHNVYWDGKDSYGIEVSSGEYFCNIKTKESNKTKKMLLLK